jgi:hypothetical protein
MLDQFKQWTAFGILMILSGCASLRMESWSDPAISERPIGKVMVLAVVEGQTTCRVFEGYFVEKLIAYGADAASAHVVLQPTGDISEQMLDEKLKADGYDSIIITRLMGKSSRNQTVYAGYTSSPSFSSFPGYYSHYHGFYAASVIHPVSYVDTYMEYQLETTLFDVQSGKMVWGGLKSVLDSSSDSSNMSKVVTSVMRDLNRKKLL